MRWPVSAAGAVSRQIDRVRRRTAIPIVFGIDVEPDPRTFDPGEPPPWRGFERFLERLPALRERLAAATNAPASFTWFLRMDPQIEQSCGSAAWLAETYRDGLAKLTAEGDELALHTHTWRWDAPERQWVADYEDADWVDHVLTLGLDAFESSLGRPCEVYRGGDYYLDGAMFSRLVERGVRVDVTVEPGRAPVKPPKDEARGLLPDYRAVPRGPYWSSPETFPVPDPSCATGPVVLPLYSTPSRHGGRWPLSPETTPGRFVPRLAAGLLLRQPPPVMVITARSDAPLNSRWDDLLYNLDHLARHRRALFVTATGAVGPART
jgi:hypothetical protein